jgi:MtrB/PioB family decaheme-associated outer membrane protein
MNARKILLIISMMFFPAFPVLAADGSFEGGLNVTGEWSNQSGDKAKYNEYRDIRKQGLYSGFLLKYDSDAFFLQGQASDIGYDTQHYRLDGGAYGKFKLYMDYNEIPHNFTYDARTFYNGVGSNNLTYTVAPTADTSSWTRFDYAIKRKTSEGGFSVHMLKPFYFNVSASREERTGTMPTSASNPVELPQPVDYRTDTVKAEVGYVKKPFFAALIAESSIFNNANHVLYFTNPTYGNGSDALNLAPDNQYYKIAFKGSANLPLNSKLNVNFGRSRTTSEADLLNSYLGTGGAITSVALSSALFHGLVYTNNADVVLTSNPLSFLNTKIYYKYYGRINRSDQITQTAGATTFTNELFNYEKNSYGIDLGFKLPAHFYLRTAYAYLQTHRTRGDLPETRDNLYSADLRWNGLDFITAKVGYEHLQRGADHGVATMVVASAQATENTIGPFLSRFDAAAQYRDTVKAILDIYPTDNLNINLGYKYKKIDYMNTYLGLRNVTAHQGNVDVGYIIGRIAKLNAYADYESNRSYQFSRNTWDVRIKDNSYAYGANVEFFIVPTKLTLVLQYDNVNSNGFLDFTYLTAALPAGRTNQNIDIGAWDDYTLRSIMAKVVYTPVKSLTMAAGYAYQSYSYDDAAWNGYSYVPVAGNYLTGAYANPSYHANMVFMSANYRF